MTHQTSWLENTGVCGVRQYQFISFAPLRDLMFVTVDTGMCTLSCDVLVQASADNVWAWCKSMNLNRLWCVIHLVINK